MNRAQKKRTAKLMRSALEVEATILFAKGYLIGSMLIRDILEKSTDDDMIAMADRVDRLNAERNAKARV